MTYSQKIDESLFYNVFKGAIFSSELITELSWLDYLDDKNFLTLKFNPYETVQIESIKSKSENI